MLPIIFLNLCSMVLTAPQDIHYSVTKKTSSYLPPVDYKQFWNLGSPLSVVGNDNEVQKQTEIQAKRYLPSYDAEKKQQSLKMSSLLVNELNAALSEHQDIHKPIQLISDQQNKIEENRQPHPVYEASHQHEQRQLHQQTQFQPNQLEQHSTQHQTHKIQKYLLENEHQQQTILKHQPHDYYNVPNHYQQHYQQPAVEATVTKDIYVHVPPEEMDEVVKYQQKASLSPRKHYRIVFIKAPDSMTKKVLEAKQAPTVEEKTIIYVLTKNEDPAALEAALQNHVISKTSKPEVYFIKYKTQEEALLAQRSIQAEFDKLGGTTHIEDEIVAPVATFAGKAENQLVQNDDTTFTMVNTNIEHHTDSANTYLPPPVIY